MTKAPKKPKTPKDETPPQEALTENQERAAKFLARAGYVKGGPRHTGALKGAARVIGVHQNTILNWLKKPAFQEVLESYESVLDDAALDGLERLLRGTESIPPNITAIIWRLKNRNPELFDEQMRRDAAKQAHEKEMFKLKVEAGVDPLTDQRLPDLVVREAGDGERIEAGPDSGSH